ADKLADAKDKTSQIIGQVATTWDQDGMKLANPELQKQALALYKEYVESFPDGRDIYIMTWNYAGLLYRLSQWREAADMYTRVVKMDPKGRKFEDSVDGAVAALANSSLPGAVETPKVPDKDVTPLEQQIVEICDIYRKQMPQGAKLASCEFMVGNI